MEGIYMMFYSENAEHITVKIGRSKNVKKRIQSYNGYSDSGRAKVMFTFFEPKQKQLESYIHKKIIMLPGIERPNKTEIFRVKKDIDIVSIVQELCKQFVLDNQEIELNF